MAVSDDDLVAELSRAFTAGVSTHRIQSVPHLVLLDQVRLPSSRGRVGGSALWLC